MAFGGNVDCDVFARIKNRQNFVEKKGIHPEKFKVYICIFLE